MMEVNPRRQVLLHCSYKMKCAPFIKLLCRNEKEVLKGKGKEDQGGKPIERAEIAR